MNRLEFVDALRTRLTEEGFNADYVNTQCSSLTEKLSQLTDESAAQYTTERNLDIIVRKLMIQDGSQRKIKPLQPKRTSPPTQSATDNVNPDAVHSDDEFDAEDDLSPVESPRSSSKPSNASVRADVEFVSESSHSSRRRTAASSASEYVPCDKPRLLTFLLALICAPTILLVLGTAFGLFGGVFLALAASIFFIVIAIIAIVAVGSVLSVASLLYGATQLLSAPRYVGFHEIGFGLLVAGVTMAAAILLYNSAIRLIPFLYLQMGKLMKWFARKIVEFAKNAVKGCEQL
jgi:hypothetical protein